MFAAAGDLDATFGTGGIVTTPFGTSSAGAESVAIQSDGKIVAAGTVESFPFFSFALARYEADGTLDATFGTAGTVTQAFSSTDVAHGLAIQPDGKLVVVGTDGTDVLLARFESDGTLDGTFGSFGSLALGVPGFPFVTTADGRAIALQADGSIVVGGEGVISTGPTISDFVVARVTPSGALDPSFGSNGVARTKIGFAAAVRGIAIQSNGKILAVGTSDCRFALVRYLDDGTPDPTFGTGGIVTTTIGIGCANAADVALQGDGRIDVAGSANPTAVDQEFAVARYETDGTLDTTFGTGGIVTTDLGTTSDQASELALQVDGSIVVAGSLQPGGPDRDFAVAVYDSNGILESTFGTGGIVTTPIGAGDDGGLALAIQGDNRIVVAGVTEAAANDEFALVRYVDDCGNGTLDTGEECDQAGLNGGESCCSHACELLGVSETCRASAGVCDLEEVCDGVAATCPADAFVPNGFPCDDGDECTTGASCVAGACGVPTICGLCESCDSGLGCVGVPKPTCKTSVLLKKGRIKIKNGTPDSRDRLIWKWSKGENTTFGAFGDPTADDNYTFCLFDESGVVPEVVFTGLAPAAGDCRGKPCWKALGNPPGVRGFSYSDKDRTPDGLGRIRLTPGEDEKAKIKIKGVGENLPLPTLPLNLPLRAQLYVDDGQCWESSYSTGGVQRNDEQQFKAKSD